MKRNVYILVFVFVIILASCSNPEINSIETQDKQYTDKIEENEQKIEENVADESNETIEQIHKIDYDNIKPNENGQIMILMYHGIGEKESEWVRTAENFRKDLKALYDNGYRLISLTDYVDNNIDVEPGYTPVILTFDDGLLNQFRIIEDGSEKKIDPNCAVGILEDFTKEYPDFGKAASFFVYYPVPFRQKDLISYKFEYLVNNGYEVGNHGYNHENLSKISIEEVQKSLAKNAKMTNEILPEYVVESLALPYGAAPKGEDYKYVVSGTFDGFDYHHKAVLKVGSNPAPSPNSIKFDPSRLPRVRASEINVQGTGIYDYIKYFQKNPDKKYISDGDPNTIAIPERETENIDMEKIENTNKQLVVWDVDNEKPDEN